MSTETPEPPGTPAPPDIPAPLVDAVGLPPGLDPRIRAQLGFLLEADRLKAVLRASPLAAVSRWENSAEHSWHLAIAVLVLAEYSREATDLARTLELVAVHDLVEIYAGDTVLGDAAAEHGQAEREQAAADALFPQLPEDLAERFRARWDEFEAHASPEARFAKALDRFVPLLHSWADQGRGWEQHGVTAAEVRGRTAAIEAAAPELAAVRDALVAEASRRGWVAPGDEI